MYYTVELHVKKSRSILMRVYLGLIEVFEIGNFKVLLKFFFVLSISGSPNSKLNSGSEKKNLNLSLPYTHCGYVKRF